MIPRGFPQSAGEEGLYRDGVLLQSTGSFNWGAGPNTNTVFKIGTSENYAPFIGLVDKLRHYNRALTSNEIAAIYAAGTNTIVPPPTRAVIPVSSRESLSQGPLRVLVAITDYLPRACRRVSSHQLF
jgi:Concanavalin A-like lectin/glucanases superfamily